MQTGFVWILAATGAYGLLHSWLASHGVKSWAESRLGQDARRFYRLFYVLAAALTLLPLALLARVLPDRPLYAIPMPWTLLAFGLQVASAFGILVAVSQTGLLAFLGLRQVSLPEPLRPGEVSLHGEEKKLVTGGLYRIVRHPIYSFSLLALWCTPLVSWNTLAFLAGLSLYLVIGAFFEERKLVTEFGEEYRVYRRETPMLLPRVWK